MAGWKHTPALLLPNLFLHSRQKDRIVAEALQNEQWIADVMEDRTVQLLDKLVRLWGLIEDVHFDPSNPLPDTIVWIRTANGEYFAKLTYRMQFDGGVFSLFPKMVWKVWAPAKCKLFMWLMLQNRVWTADRLLLREWPNSYFYPMCYRNLETAQHLFVECRETRYVWRSISNWSGLVSFNPDRWEGGCSLVD